MEIVLPKLEPWQKDVADCLNNISGTGKIFSVLSQRQVGKSILMAEALIHFAGNNPDTISMIVEPTFSQCKNIFSTMVKWLRNVPIVENINNAEMSVLLINGSKIICKSCAQRDGLRGYTCDFLCVDEACFVPEDVYPIILPWANAKNAPILLVSTPLFREGTFYNFWSNPDGETSFSFDWSKYNKSKYLTAKKLEYFRKTMPKNQFEAEFLGKWIEDGSFVFTNIGQCTRYEDKENMGQAVACGIDWGSGQSQDYTWLTFINSSNEVTKVVYFNTLTPKEQIEKIAEEINNCKTLESLVVEKNSIGAVYGDILYEKLDRPEIMDFFITVNESKRRVIETVVTMFQNNNISIPNDPELISQLLHYTVVKTKTTITYNGLPGYHDDACMSLAMAVEALNNSVINIEDDIRF